MTENKGIKIAYGVLCRKCEIDLKNVQFKYRGVYYLLYRCPNCLEYGLTFVGRPTKWENVPEVLNIDDKVMARIESNFADMERVQKGQI